MENQGNSSNQSRFLIAAVLSMAILFGWQYFFAPKPPPVDNANSNTAANTAANANTASPVPTPAPAPLPETAAATTPDTTPNRSITIKSPLYEVKLDSKGALATSWIIVKNKSPRADFPVYADGSHEGEQKP
ncbi:MAG TPA: membrane protein insertase YidC, partial [Pyrinomonadaceae bacterium]|nr:membrane protein insertase YidC [Pyrinomonadaceae bacterium]